MIPVHELREGPSQCALESGAEALFTKPIDFLLLRNEIDTARPDVPVIMITAYGDAETKRKAPLAQVAPEMLAE